MSTLGEVALLLIALSVLSVAVVLVAEYADERFRRRDAAARRKRAEEWLVKPAPGHEVGGRDA